MPTFVRKSGRLRIICLLVQLFFTSTVLGQAKGDYRTKQTGSQNWSSLALWERYDGSAWLEPSVSEGYPGEYAGTGNVLIRFGSTVTLNVSPAYAIGSLNIGDGTITGTGLGNASATLNISASTLSVKGNLGMASANASRDGILNNNTGIIKIAGSFTRTSGTTYNINTGTFEYYGNGNQTILNTTYYNLVLSGGGTKNLTEHTPVNATLTVRAGTTFGMGIYSLSILKSLVLEAGAVSGSSITGSNGITLDGNVTVNDVNKGVNGATISCPIYLTAGQRSFIVNDDETDAVDLTVNGEIWGNGTLHKTGTGRMELKGSNTYSGGTRLQEGELQIGAPERIPNASSLALLGGTFSTGSAAGFSETLNTLTLNNNASINLGTLGHSLKFAASNHIAWSGSLLTVNGWTGKGGSSGTGGKVFFGTAAGSLTGVQLNKISFTGYPGTPILLSTGELVPPLNCVAPSNLQYTTSISSYCAGETITNNIPSLEGDAPTSYSISPSLPAGLNFNTSTGVISGTSVAVSPVTNYTITATNDCGTSQTTISITVTAPPTWYMDGDGDGYYTGTGITQCTSPGGGYRSSGLMGGDDCNDKDPDLWRSGTVYVDEDGDGYAALSTIVCYGETLPEAYSTTSKGPDCIDNDPTVWQSAMLYRDADGDGYTVGSGEMKCYGAVLPMGWIAIRSVTDDCDDTKVAVNPAANEVCDGLDNDCDGLVDEGFTDTDGDSQADCLDVDDDNDGAVDANDCAPLDPSVRQSAMMYRDEDGDSYTVGNGEVVCYGALLPRGWSLTKSATDDCNDNDRARYATFSFYVDADGDGIGAGSLVSGLCSVDANTPPAGYSLKNTDCAPADATRWRIGLLYVDADGDGYTSYKTPVCYGASIPAGYRLSANGNDCNDNDATVWQSGRLYADGDGDGYTAGTGEFKCYGATLPAGWTEEGSEEEDCNDNDASLTVTKRYYVDGDKDGYGAGAAVMLCTNMEPYGYAVNDTDCDDNNPAINPGIALAITAPADITTAKTSDDGNGDCTTTIALGTATHSDNCTGPYTLKVYIGNTEVTSLTKFGTGNTVVTWKLVNNTGNVVATKSQNINVADDESPVLTPAADQAVSMKSDNAPCSIIVPDVRGSATDNCSGVVITQSPEMGEVVTASHNGTITVTVTATDGAGLKDVKTVILTAKDVTKPVLTPGATQDVSMNAEPGACSITVPDLRGMATDNCSGTVITQSPAVGASVAAAHNEPIPIMITATDAAGLTDVKTVTITAKDLTAPVLNLPTITAQTFDPLKCGAVLSISPLTAEDNCGGVTKRWTITRNHFVEAFGSGDIDSYVFGIGTSIISFTISDAAGLTNTKSTTVVVNPLTVTPELTVQALDDNGNEKPATTSCEQQYSDKVRYKAVIPNGKSNCLPGAVKAATSATFYLTNGILTQEIGTANFEAVPNTLTIQAVIDERLVEQVAKKGILTPGSKTVSVVINGENTAVYDVQDVMSKTLKVMPEDADPVTYSGPTVFGAQLQGRNYAATVSLSSVISDKVDNASNRGNITNAKATYKFNGTTYANLEVGLMNPNDTTVGIAARTGIAVQLTNSEVTSGGKVLELHTQLDTYNLTTKVGGYYTGKAIQPDIITIVLSGSEFVNGGGFIKLPTTTNGYFAGEVGTRANFGLTMKWNKSGANLQGNMNMIYRGKDGRIYQVKSNAINSLVVTDVLVEGRTGRKAVINTKAEFRELRGETAVVLKGNMDFTVEAFEDAEDNTGKHDRISFRLVNPSSGNAQGDPAVFVPAGLIFANDLNGTAVNTTQLSGGKLNVRTSVLATLTQTPVITKADGEKVSLEVDNIFNLMAYPNPATSHFNVVVESADTKEKIVVMVFDVKGRMVETRSNLSAGQTIRLGSEYKPGLYIIEMIQGSNRKQLKVMKQLN